MKRFAVRMSLLLGSLILMVALITLLPENANADTYYNRQAAADYASTHWNSGGGQCAQFVSECLNAGGINVFNTYAADLRLLLLPYGTVYNITWHNKLCYDSYNPNIEVGDVVFYYCARCSDYPHTAFIYKKDTDGVFRFCQHNGYYEGRLHNSFAHPHYNKSTEKWERHEVDRYIVYSEKPDFENDSADELERITESKNPLPGNITTTVVHISAATGSDTEPPKITSAKITSVTENGYDVTCTVSDNHAVKQLGLGTWNDAIGVNNADWIYEDVAATNVNYTFHVDISNFGNRRNTVYHSNLYAFDYAGNRTLVSLGDIPIGVSDTVAPTITGAKITSVTETGYDVTCTVTDDYSVRQLRLGSWNDVVGISNAVWDSPDFSSKSVTYTFHVDASRFGNQLNTTYHSNLYAYDFTGHYSFVSLEGVWIGTDNHPTVTSAYITNEKADEYTVVVSASDDIGLASIGIRTWNDILGKDSLYYQSASVSGRTGEATFKVDLSGYDFQCTGFHTEAWAVDSRGQYSLQSITCDVTIDAVKPQLTDLRVENITPTSYEVYAAGTDNVAVSRIITRTVYEGMPEDQVRYVDAVLTGNEGRIVIDISDYSNMQNVAYRTDVWICDAFGNWSEGGSTGDIVLEATCPLLVECSINDLSSEGYSVYVKATDNSKLARLCVETWHSGMNEEDAQWQELQVEDGDYCIHSFRISYSDFGNTNDTTFYSRVYAYDVCGNFTSVVREPAPFVIDLYESRDEELTMYLPDALTVIESEAFSGVSARYFVLPSGVTSIQAGAFPANTTVFLYGTGITDLSDDLFGGQGTIVEMGTGLSNDLANQLSDTGVWYIMRDGSSIIPFQTE